MEYELSDKIIINLSDEILKRYKDGFYAFDEDAKAQKKTHYNHKTHAKSWLVNILNEIMYYKGEHKWCREPFIQMITDCDTDVINDLKQQNRQFKKQNEHHKEQLKLRQEGQDSSMCGLCFYKVKDAQEKFQKQYAIDNNLTTLQEEVQTLKEKCYKNNMDCIKYESIINDLREQLQDMKYELNHLKTENVYLKEQMSKNELKDDKNKNKNKKKKKKKNKKQPEINTKQLKKLLKFMEAQEQSSSSEEDDNPFDDDGWKSDDDNIKMNIDTSSSEED